MGVSAGRSAWLLILWPSPLWAALVSAESTRLQVKQLSGVLRGFYYRILLDFLPVIHQ